MPGPQVILRPEGWRPGEPSPWADVPQHERSGLDIGRIRALMHGGPPVDAHPAEHDRAGSRPAAVLVALFDEEGEANVVLTRRAATMRSHRHQVAFPGGRLDPGELAEDAARREAQEEVGIDPATVELLGPLPPLSTFAGLAAITPFVGVLPGRPVLRPNPAEVEHAFSVPLADLLDGGCHWEERWPYIDGVHYPVHFFDLPEDVVWGATARIVVALLCQLLALPVPQAWP